LEGTVGVGEPGRTGRRGDLAGLERCMGRGNWIGWLRMKTQEKIRRRDGPEDDSMGVLSTKSIPAPSEPISLKRESTANKTGGCHHIRNQGSRGHQGAGTGSLRGRQKHRFG